MANEKQATSIKATDVQLKRVAKYLQTLGVPCESKIEKLSMGYGLHALIVAHSFRPCTHSQAVELANQLIHSYHASYTGLTTTPKLHFGLAKGGIGGYQKAYDPKTFGVKRGGLVWACNEHGHRFDKCNATCPHGVRVPESTPTSGAWVGDKALGRKVNKPKAPRKAASSTPSTTTNENVSQNGSNEAANVSEVKPIS